MTASRQAGEKPARFLVSRLPDWVILLFFSVLLLTQTILSIREKAATFDETVHLPAGYLHLRFGDYGFNPAHPPLAKMLGAVPLLFTDVKMPSLERPFVNYRDGIRFLYEENDADRLLFLGRVAMLPLAVLLGWVIFFWTRRLFGRAAAVFAVLLYSFEPNILAHAPLVNTDVGATAFLCLAIFSFCRLLHRVSIPRLILAGFSLGLALITKFSTLPLFPMLFLLGVGVVFTHHTIHVGLTGSSFPPVATRTRKVVILAAAMVGMGLVAYVTIWAAYRFRFEGITLPGQVYQGTWDQVLPAQGWMRRAMVWIRDLRLLPEAYLFGFLTVPPSLPRLTFMLGKFSTTGWWYYFIVTFVLKTPLPLLLLLLVVPLALRPLWRRDPVGIWCLLVPVVVYFGIACASRINIGHRHILPVYPFLFVMAGSLVPWARQQRVYVKASLAALAAWYVVSSVAVFPHYLAYFNEIAGGPRNGYKYLVDSNLDWGQDLKGLKRYMDGHGIDRVWLSYFGTASPDYYRIAYHYLPGYRPPTIDKGLTPYVAISATNLQGFQFRAFGLDKNYFADFLRQEPVAKIGYSIFLYRID